MRSLHITPREKPELPATTESPCTAMNTQSSQKLKKKKKKKKNFFKERPFAIFKNNKTKEILPLKLGPFSVNELQARTTTYSAIQSHAVSVHLKLFLFKGNKTHKSTRMTRSYYPLKDKKSISWGQSRSLRIWPYSGTRSSTFVNLPDKWFKIWQTLQADHMKGPRYFRSELNPCKKKVGVIEGKEN